MYLNRIISTRSARGNGRRSKVLTQKHGHTEQKNLLRLLCRLWPIPVVSSLFACSVLVEGSGNAGVGGCASVNVDAVLQFKGLPRRHFVFLLVRP